MAKLWEEAHPLPYGAFKSKAEPVAYVPATVNTPDVITVAVCGAHLQGFPLNWQLSERNAKHLETTATAAKYQMYLLDQTTPAKPGLVRDNTDGVSIAVEVWSVPATEFGSFVDNIPYPLGIGKIELKSGAWVNGFICDPAAVTDCRNISMYGSWRTWAEDQ